MIKMGKSKITINHIIYASLIVLMLIGSIFLERFGTSGNWTMLIACIKKASVFALVAVSMNLLNGFTGLFSLGQAGFMLIGAYTYAIFTIPFSQRATVYYLYIKEATETAPAVMPVVQFSFPEVLGNVLGGFGMYLGVLIAIILAGLVAAGIAFLIGLPVLRMKSDYLAIATLGFAEIIRAVFQWSKLGTLTNGANPLKNFVTFNSFKVNIGATTYSLGTFMALLLAVICIGIIVMLVNSSYGRAFKAIREDEVAAEAMGLNLYRLKQLAFCISCFFAGVGGAMLAMFINAAQALNFKAAMTYEILLMVVLGGIGSISGSCIAAVLFVFAMEWWLRGFDSGTFLGINAPLIFRNGFRLVIISVIIMSVILFFRRGLLGDKELPYYVGRLKEWITTRKAKAGEQNG
ncbi:MAG: branched-chain amino acid ABC transporter permease [Clostridiales bacterium]|nr:branched-chain amino acid ABC transporter permease [Clostridiales bacterium]